MKRGNFLRMFAASPLGFLVPKGEVERNVLELTVPEFTERLGMANRSATDLLMLTKGFGLEMYENNRVCGKCGGSTYRYRWLDRGEVDNYFFVRPDPEPWYCACGFEVGAEWGEEVHVKSLNWNKTVRFKPDGNWPVNQKW